MDFRGFVSASTQVRNRGSSAGEMKPEKPLRPQRPSALERLSAWASPNQGRVACSITGGRKLCSDRINLSIRFPGVQVIRA